MTRRVTIAVVAAVAVALVLAGLGTVVLAGRDARDDARARLEEQATNSAALVAFFGNQVPAALPALRRALGADGVEVVPLDETLRDRLPDGAAVTPDDVRALAAGRAVSFTDRGDIVAIARVPRRRPAQAVVVSTNVPLLDRSLTGWVIGASLVTLTLAALLGAWLARRMARPLRDVDAAARRIAGGDLGARVDVPATNDEVAQLARSVNDMSGALAHAKDVERSFLLSISHDLRTPLTSIRGYAEGLDDGTMTDVRRATQVILQETGRLERLVADLLELARLDARQFSLRSVPTDVGDTVADAAAAFRPAFDAEGVALDVTVEPALIADVDPDRLGQIVANLVENALKYAHSRVVVTAAAGGRGVRVSVSDDGAGVPLEEQARVFERLYTGQRPARRQVGTGLGLAIVAELVGAMAGTVRCDSLAAGGTTFVVELPRADQPSPR